jgi:hypothetical protein
MDYGDSWYLIPAVVTGVIALLLIFGAEEPAYKVVGIVFALISAYCFWRGKGGDSDTGTKY